MKLRKPWLLTIIIGTGLHALPSWALEAGDFYVQFGYSKISPHVDSGELKLSNVPSIRDNPIVGGSLLLTSIRNGNLEGSGVNVKNTDFMGAIVGYMITDHFSIELPIAPPPRLEIDSDGTLATQSLAKIINYPTLSGKIGYTDVAPIVVTAVYHPWPKSWIRPYIGAGAAYTLTYHERITNRYLMADPVNENGRPQFEISNALSAVGQAGINVDLWRNLYFNIDVKYINQSVDAKVKNIIVDPGAGTGLGGSLGGIIGQLTGPINIGDAKVKVDVNPWVYSAGLGWRF
jgi:outer membrane protein